jgi:hypothetical protein
MTEVQNNHFRMFIAVQILLDERTSLLSNIPIMMSLKNQFDELIQRISEISEKTSATTKHLTQNKQQVRKTLANKAAMLSGVIQAYEAFNGNTEIDENLSFTTSDVLYGKEAEVETIVRPVINATKEILEELAEFSITEETVLDVETSLDDYLFLIGKPRAIRNKVFAAKDQMEELFDEANGLLRFKLDPLMLRYKTSDPEFYNEYNRARVIVD